MCFPSISLLTFHLHFTFLSSQHSQHIYHDIGCVMCSIRLYIFLLFFPILISICFFCLSHHILIIYTCIELKQKTQHTFRNVFPVVTVTGSTQGLNVRGAADTYSEIPRKRDNVFKQTEVGSKIQYSSYKLTYLFFDIVGLSFNTFSQRETSLRMPSIKISGVLCLIHEVTACFTS
jgi:hypothetical protein